MRRKRSWKSSLCFTQTKEVILGPDCASAQQAGTYRLLLLLSCGETEQRKKERKRLSPGMRAQRQVVKDRQDGSRVSLCSHS